MKKMKWSFMAVALTVCLVVSSMVALAQDRGGRGNFDPEQMRERMLDRYQEMLELSNDEWAVIKPMVSDVMEKQFTARGRGGFPGFGGPMMGRQPRGGQEGGQPRGDQPRGDRQNRARFGGESDPEVEALQAVIEKEGASAEEIKTKLADLRKARQNRQAALKQAQEKLRQVLTVKQEATLVLSGMLE
jgi:Spy/CpxP family protein refolding chaperone